MWGCTVCFVYALYPKVHLVNSVKLIGKYHVKALEKIGTY